MKRVHLVGDAGRDRVKSLHAGGSARFKKIVHAFRSVSVTRRNVGHISLVGPSRILATETTRV
jgi:hypothetical protein